MAAASGARLESVNASAGIDAPWVALGSSGIDKRPTTGPTRVHVLGVEGDTIVNTRHHGGVDQAVYVYAREDLDDWSRILGRPLASGCFGENLTTVGLDVQDVRLGDRWRIGSVLAEVTGIRTPCAGFARFMGEPQWMRRFIAHGVPGAYLRVIEEGELEAGDAIDVVERRDHDLTVAFAFRALTTERHLLPRLEAEPRISASIRRKLDALQNRSTPTQQVG